MPIVKLNTTRAHQRYKLANGTVVPGGSTIAHIACASESEGALMAWAWRMGQEGIDYRKKRDVAATAGTVAHFLIECHLRGDTPDLSEVAPDTVSAAETSYLKWLEWWEKQNATPLYVEHQAVSEEYGYGGTIDLVYQRNDSGIIGILDNKTSNGIYLSHWVQIAGYRNLLKERIDEHVIARVGREDDPADFEFSVKTDVKPYWAVFKAGLKLHESLRFVRKSGRGGE